MFAVYSLISLFLYGKLEMALLLLAVTPFIFGVVVLLDKKAKPVYVDLREKLSQMNTDAQENISGNRVVKAFAREDYEMESSKKPIKSILMPTKSVTAVA